MGAENGKMTNVSKNKMGSDVNKTGSVNSDGEFIFIMSDRCGHCITLKKSGEIEKVEKVMPVYRMTDKTDGYGDIMKEVSSRGFPTIVMVKGGVMKQYSGDRTAKDMLQKIKKM